MEGQTYKIQIGEHVFETPPEPPHKEILFWNKKKADQYWTRQTDFPKVFFDWWHNDENGDGVELDASHTKYDGKVLKELSKEDTAILFDKFEETGHEGLQEREMRRRTQGIWMYNEGESTYLTCHHYDILQWSPMLGCSNDVEPNSSYGQYYQFQRDALYYYDIAKHTTYGRGGILVKGKKTGLTQLMSLVCLNEATTHREKNIRLMNITESLCKESNFNLIIYAVSKRPPILLPSRSKQNLGEIIFGQANASRNPLKKRKESNLEPLNTWLTTVPTTRTAFDTFTNYLALIDEFPKIKENTYPQELFETTIVTVQEGFKRKGTIFAMSYIPEQSDRSFYESRILYKGSKLKTRKQDETGNYYGETSSKLICHTLTVQEGMFSCCTKYGKPIAEKIWAAIKQEQEDTKGDPQKLQAVNRQYPTNENMPWSEASREDSLFDNLRLDAQLQEMEDLAATGILPYVQFNLSYKTPKKREIGTYYDFDLNVRYEEITHDQIMKGASGLYKWFDKELLPDWFLQKYRGGITVDKKTGLLKPNPHSPFVISLDPTNYRSKKYTSVGSMNAMHAFVLPNVELNSYIGKNVTKKRMFIEYHFRQDSPNLTLQDVIKLVLYLGCMILIEANVTTWSEDFIEYGLGNFLLMLNKDGAIVPYTGLSDQKLISSQTSTIDDYVIAGQKHLEKPLNDEIDVIKQIKSTAVLSQLQIIRKEDTREYDAGVSYLLGNLACDALLGWRRAREDQKKLRGNGMMGQAALKLMR